jgi:hypothetical protein
MPRINSTKCASRISFSSAPWVDLLPQISVENTGPDFQQGRAVNPFNGFAYVFAAEPSITAVRSPRAQFNEL